MSNETRDGPVIVFGVRCGVGSRGLAMLRSRCLPTRRAQCSPAPDVNGVSASIKAVERAINTRLSLPSGAMTRAPACSGRCFSHVGEAACGPKPCGADRRHSCFVLARHHAGLRSACLAIRATRGFGGVFVPSHHRGCAVWGRSTTRRRLRVRVRTFSRESTRHHRHRRPP